MTFFVVRGCGKRLLVSRDPARVRRPRKCAEAGARRRRLLYGRMSLRKTPASEQRPRTCAETPQVCGGRCAQTPAVVWEDESADNAR